MDLNWTAIYWLLGTLSLIYNWCPLYSSEIILTISHKPPLPLLGGELADALT